jgi:hypothetical protein
MINTVLPHTKGKAVHTVDQEMITWSIKTKVQDSMSKKMVMPYFDQQGAIFTHCVLLAITVNAAYNFLGSL